MDTMKRLLGVVLAACALGGCSPREQSAASAPANPAAPKLASQAEWKAALNAIRHRLNERNGNDGTTEYDVCIGERADGCKVPLTGSVDAFKRVEWIYDTQTAKNRGVLTSTVRVYLAIRECGIPSVHINPMVVQKGSWIFLRQVQVMAGSEVVLDLPLPNVRRDPASSWILEFADQAVTPSQMEGLRKALTVSPVIVRLSGEHDNVTLIDSAKAAFVKSLQEIIPAYDATYQAISKLGPLECEPRPPANQSSGSSRPL